MNDGPSDDGGMVVLRRLDMGAMDAIGFDLDDTLAVYRRARVHEVTVAAAVQRLIDAHGYDPHIASLAYDPEFGMRGLLIDRRLGHVLKLSHDGAVERAYHGLLRLDVREIARLYPRAGLGPNLGLFEVESLFSTAIPVVFAALIDDAISRGETLVFHRVLHDVIAAVTHVLHEGAFSRTVVGAGFETAVHRDADLAATLGAFRSAGRTLFVLTNSSWEAADRVMTALLSDPAWPAQFHTVVVGADKPAFFTTDRPFVAPVAPDAPGPVLQGGHARALTARLGVAPDRVLYLGDHVRDDLAVPRESCGWNTAMLAGELDRETGGTHSTANRYWGALLTSGPGDSGFVRRVARHASVIVPRVSAFLRYAPTHVFEPRATRPHAERKGDAP